MFFTKKCWHEWELLKEILTESKFESVLNKLKECDLLNRESEIPIQLCNAERKLIQILVCKKCGEIKKLVEII